MANRRTISKKLEESTDSELYRRVAEIIEAARLTVARTVNTAMVHAYWLVGREIVEEEQKGAERAGYGEQLIRRLSKQLTARFGKGFTSSSVKRMRQFYLAFPQGQEVKNRVFAGSEVKVLLSPAHCPRSGVYFQIGNSD